MAKLTHTFTSLDLNPIQCLCDYYHMSWFLSPLHHPQQPHLLVYGPPHAGKYTLLLQQLQPFRRTYVVSTHAHASITKTTVPPASSSSAAVASSPSASLAKPRKSKDMEKDKSKSKRKGSKVGKRDETTPSKQTDVTQTLADKTNTPEPQKARSNKRKQMTKESTVPRSIPSMSFVSSAKDNPSKGGSQGTVGSLIELMQCLSCFATHKKKIHDSQTTLQKQQIKAKQSKQKTLH